MAIPNLGPNQSKSGADSSSRTFGSSMPLQRGCPAEVLFVRHNWKAFLKTLLKESNAFSDYQMDILRR